MPGNFRELGVITEIKLTAEAACTTVFGVGAIKLAESAIAHISRGDIPNAVWEAAGTILGIGIAVISGRVALKTADNTSQNK